MSELLQIQRILVPSNCIQLAHMHLQRMGQLANEGFALWAGDVRGEDFLVQETIIPNQRAVRTATGMCVTVDGNELHRINVWLYEHRMTLVAQLHSHPSDAYHSETDDTYPIATASGSVSIVVPNFAQTNFSLTECAIYRLLPECGWVLLKAREVQDLLLLVN